MRGLDTNVLVRYLTADDKKQLASADQIIEECRKNQEPLFLSAIVLCELVWVLTSAYGQAKPALVNTLEQILDMDLFQIEYDALVHRSLDAYRHGKGNFSDYLIGEIGKHHGCRDIVTFDRALKNSKAFTVLLVR
jgi:predicted nucleic-acid-binding protein